MLKRLAILAPFFLTVATASAQSSDPSWLDDLNIDAALAEKCEVIVVLSTREGKLGANNVYEARVKCADGRLFDASRIGELEQFTFKACEIQVC